MAKAAVLKDKQGNSIFPVTDASLITGLKEGFMDIVEVDTLPAASGDTRGKLYMIESTETENEYDRYITVYENGAYSWKQLTDTTVPTPVIADNLTTNDATKALSAKQGYVLEGEVSQLREEVGILYNGDAPVGTILFDSTQVSPGDKVYVRVKILQGQFAFELFNASDQVQETYYSSGASVGDIIVKEITIPANFSYAKTKWQHEYYFVDIFRHIAEENIEQNAQNIASIDGDVRSLETLAPKLYPATQNIINPSDFEIGSINITTSGWYYSASTTRARTKQGTSLHLYPGDTIAMVPTLHARVNGNTYSYYRFYLGWKNSAGEYKTGGGWLGYFVVQEEGDYVLTMYDINTSTGEATISDANDLVKHLYIYSTFDTTAELAGLFDASQGKSFYHSINHRGYSADAPENTLPAYVLSKKKGFAFVETDIKQTADGIYVLLHDDSINRTARNMDGTSISQTINISDITYAQALQYDFGIWKGQEFAGTQIPTLGQFLALCRNLGLHAYLDLKAGSDSYLAGIIDQVRGYGMEQNVSFIGGLSTLEYIETNLPSARIGLLGTNLSSQMVSDAISLRTGTNRVFIDVQYFKEDSSQETAYALAKANGIPIETWVYDQEWRIEDFDDYISGITSDYMNYADKYMDITLRRYFPVV